MQSQSRVGLAVVLSCGALVAVAACFSTNVIVLPDGGAPPGSGGAASGAGGRPGSGGIGGGLGTGGTTVSPCPNGMATTITGTVRDPAGKVPVYHALVYVPPGEPLPLTDGPSCRRCATTFPGNVAAVTMTDSSGGFVLTNVPSGANFQLVIEIGKWRRQVTVPSVPACMTTAIADASMTRLPRNQSEGHLPKIALTTGGSDALECMLRKIGLDDSEFTPEAGPGRVNLFAGGLHDGVPMANGSRPAAGTDAYSPALNGGARFADAEAWWGSLDNLRKYDLVLYSCEGVEMSTNKSETAMRAFYDYVSMGGRALATHWHNYWLEHGPAPLPTVATFNHRTDPPVPFTATVDVGHLKGLEMADWLVNVGASTSRGQLTVLGAKRTIGDVNPLTTQRWIYDTALATTQVLSFAAPIGAPEACGQVVFSDIHVSSGSATSTEDASSPSLPFPSGCVTTDLSPQEKALEFMLFDLAACAP